MLPILATLASNGLSLLAGAIQAKGKEYIESKLGVKIPSEITPEIAAKLKELELKHEEFLLSLQVQKAQQELEAEKAASMEVTKRWEADMRSDSYLSKNIRPLTLIFILAVYTVFALLSSTSYRVDSAYVELLGQWGMLIMSAYFVGRTVEKGIAIVNKK